MRGVDCHLLASGRKNPWFRHSSEQLRLQLHPPSQYPCPAAPAVPCSNRQLAVFIAYSAWFKPKYVLMENVQVRVLCALILTTWGSIRLAGVGLVGEVGLEVASAGGACSGRG
jgi:hypothetical protein